jgi:hypothetical protein
MAKRKPVPFVPPVSDPGGALFSQRAAWLGAMDTVYAAGWDSRAFEFSAVVRQAAAIADEEYGAL